MQSTMGRRTKLEIAEKLIAFLKEQKRPFFKTRVVEADLGMNSKTAEEWLDLYIAIQKGPKIRKITFEKSVGYEVIEE